LYKIYQLFTGNSLSQVCVVLFNKFSKWARYGFFALLDQGLFSAVNFLTSIFLARWMEEKDFGVYSVAYTLFLFLSGFHNALILEPASIIGPSSYQSRIRSYIKTNTKLHFYITIPISLLLITSGIFLINFQIGLELGMALISVGISFPFMLYLWWFRRACYLLYNPVAAFWTSFLYSFLSLGGVFLLYSSGKLQTIIIFGLLGTTSVLSTIPLSRIKRTEADNPKISLNKTLSENLKFGKWVIVGALLYIGGGQIQTFFVTAITGFEGTAALRAMYNFFLPMALSITAISNLILPYLSKDFGIQNYKSLVRKGLIMTFVMSIFSIMYFLAIFLTIQPLEQMLYGGKYAAYVRIGIILSLVPLLSSISSGFSVILRSIQKLQIYIIVNGVVFFGGVITGWFFTLWWGVEGAAWSLVFSNLIAAIVTIIMFLKYLYLLRGNQ